ncbi:hypothetical protein SAMN05421823_102753 [Catalinimonas alkaloidigena]|uniref:YdhG-like domain-containing protein n=1 Tax=Catalinimonas alkaloidigena TaxID=1075417 RepID=A0A1G9BZA0_9BACT|nr:DUF1801 domain-containing protein [Catalinimonas alkaloidigena]SDK44703.1 hypothetical protein SAMN05421823_102753 [Catalinimonas alkaloidigena]
MRTIETYGQFHEILIDATPPVQDLAFELRTLIQEVYPDVVEVPWPRQRITGFGIGPKKMSEHFCYIAVHRHHINLGFNHGGCLDDPTGLLGGEGKKFRHIKLATPDDIDHGALRQLLEIALYERRAALS